eukprot:424642_1
MLTARLRPLIKHIPIQSSLGAYIYDYDFQKPFTSDTIDYLNQLLLNYQVLVFRNENNKPIILNDEQLVQFTKCFGEPQIHTAINASYNPLHPEVWYISNIDKYGNHLGSDYIAYHADLTYMGDNNIGRVTILHAMQLAEINKDNKFINKYDCCEWGATSYMNTYETYNALSEEMKQNISNYKGMFRHHIEAQNPYKDKLIFRDIIQKHSVTGKYFLNINPRHTQYLQPDNPDLYQYLIDHNCNNMEFVYKHYWKTGDVVVWDNESTMHSRDAFDNNKFIRVMKRTQIYGDNSSRYIPQVVEDLK